MSRPSARRRSLTIIEREMRSQEVYKGTAFVLLRRLWRDYLRKRKMSLAIGLLAGVIGAGIHLAFPLTLRFLLDKALLPADFTNPGTMQSRQGLVLVFLGLNCGIWAISLSSQWVRSWLILTLGQWLVFNIRRDLNEKLHNLHIGFFERTPSGRIMSRLLDDVDMIRHWVTGHLVEFIGGITRLIIGTSLAFY
jgi:ABC-type multidrug transport system fused ATPase/permease subunit